MTRLASDSELKPIYSNQATMRQIKPWTIGKDIV